MKSIFKIAACLSFLALLVNACKLEDIDTQMTEEEAVAAIKLDCDALESYTIQAKRPQAVSFTVNSTTPWTVTVSEGADWLTVTPASSAVSSLSEDIRITFSGFTLELDPVYDVPERVFRGYRPCQIGTDKQQETVALTRSGAELTVHRQIGLFRRLLNGIACRPEKTGKRNHREREKRYYSIHNDIFLV